MTMMWLDRMFHIFYLSVNRDQVLFDDVDMQIKVTPPVCDLEIGLEDVFKG